MKKTWIIILLQSALISYLLFFQPQANKSQSTPSLEFLRKAAGNSALMQNQPESSHIPSACHLAFGFSSLVDIRTRFVDFIRVYPAPAEAKHHESLNNKQQMLETLAYGFSTGRGAEFRIPRALFEEVLSVIYGIQYWKTLGGNGASMCKRASHEGCYAYLASPLTEDMKGYFDENKTIFLNEFLSTPDLHIILEYREGESWGKFVASRSNRFYLNHDSHNVDPNVFKGLDKIKGVQGVRVLALGGFQLVEGSAEEEVFLQTGLNKVKSIKADGIKMHFEMGDFHSYQFFSKLQELIKEADSIGMNEQELGILLCHLKKIKFNGYPSKAPIKKYLSDLSDLISILSQSYYQASRIHLHTISTQVICSSSIWSHPLKPTARSALLAGQFACNNTDLQSSTLSFYESTDWKAEEITKCWAESEMTCCIALNPTCTEVVQVSGLGDNISAIGLVYHNLI